MKFQEEDEEDQQELKIKEKFIMQKEQDKNPTIKVTTK